MLNIQTSLKSCLNLTWTISIKVRNKVIFLFTLMDLANVLTPAVFKRLAEEGVLDKVVVSRVSLLLILNVKATNGASIARVFMKVKDIAEHRRTMP